MSDHDARIAALPLWRGRPRIAPLSGGLSNVSFKVEDGGGSYVVRIGGDYPFHGVERSRELRAARAAYAAGLAPEIVHDEPGLMVSRFIEGRVFDRASVRAEIPRVAALVRRFHEDVPAEAIGGHRFDVFAVVRGYARELARADDADQDRIAGLLALNDALEAAVPPGGDRMGHNDLLPANIIDDGERLWLIDYEYAGLAPALFDLGGLASNACFETEHSEALLGAYFGRRPDADTRRAHLAMQCASLLREALWSLVSEVHLSAPGADYGAYAAYNFKRLDLALAGWQAAEAPQTQRHRQKA